MLPATDEERANITRYFLSQSSGVEVSFLQKAYSEVILGHRHDVWDIHASDGRWWVITNPTNLYSQDQFPNMDLAVTFHIGLCLRIPRTEEQRTPLRNIIPFGAMFAKLRETSDALRQAQNIADYQAIGMRSREVLLAFIAAAQDAAEWISPTSPIRLSEAAPKRADFRAWVEVIFNVALAGPHQKERRQLMKSLLDGAWKFANWLTHAQSATWHDAEAAITTTEHAVGLAASLTIMHIRSVPEQCPNCGSPHLSPEEGWREDLPEIAWERPVCGDCGWAGTPVVVGERTPDAEGEELIIRVGGGDNNECAMLGVPLTKLGKKGKSPNDRPRHQAGKEKKSFRS
jgi:hypothetical protein